MSEMKWCFSTNGETFDGRFDSREEAIEEARESGEDFADIGRAKPIDFAEIARLLAKDTLEDAIICQIGDLVGDCAEGAAQSRDFVSLANQVAPILEAWLTKHYSRFYEVVQTESVKLATL